VGGLGEACGGDVGAAAGAVYSGGKDVSSGIGGEEMVVGAGAGEGWSGVPHVGVGGRCGEPCDRGVCSGVSEDAGVGVGGSGNRAGRGGVHSGGERHRSSSSNTSLNSSTSQRLFAAFLVLFAGGGEGAGGDLGSESSVGGSAAKASGRGA
jgi:hypothetical protein